MTDPANPPVPPGPKTSYGRFPTPNRVLKAMANQLGVSVKDLLVLSPQNDPFNSGTPTDRSMAEWLVNLAPADGAFNGRQLHYRHSSFNGAAHHDGTPYENTERDLNVMNIAGKHVRYLGLVDPRRVRDEKKNVTYLHADETPHEPVNVHVEAPEWTLPAIYPSVLDTVDMSLPTVDVSGYEYSGNRQPWHVEVWIEKATMDEVLEPVCRRYGVNLVATSGFQSIRGVIDALDRATARSKNAVILYVSDFDPAGAHMPFAVARQVEFWTQQLGFPHRFMLKPLVLTREQVEAYDLPRKPIKEKDRRRGNFEKLNGQGHVELDALESHAPGELERVVANAIREHQDATLHYRYSDAEAEAVALLDQAQDEIRARFAPDLDELRREIEDTTRQYRRELERLAADLDADLAPYRQRFHDLRQAITDATHETVMTTPLPVPPEPSVDVDASTYLLDTSREYVDQLNAYRAAKGEPPIISIQAGGAPHAG